MFKDDYKNFMDKQNPSDEVVEFTKLKMQDEKSASKKSKIFRPFHKKLIAAAACLALIVAAIPVMMQFGGTFNEFDISERDFERDYVVAENLDDFYRFLRYGAQRHRNFAIYFRPDIGDGGAVVSLENVSSLPTLEGNDVICNYENQNTWNVPNVNMPELTVPDHDNLASPGGGPNESPQGIAPENSMSPEAVLRSLGIVNAAILRAEGNYIYAMCDDYGYIVRFINGNVESFLQIDRREFGVRITDRGLFFYFSNP